MEGSVRGILNHLAALRIIRDKNVRDWNSLRNHWVHRKPPENWGHVETTSVADCVLTLFHHLIFHLIGYGGPYIDYSTEGWPEQYYVLRTLSGEVSPSQR